MPLEPKSSRTLTRVFFFSSPHLPSIVGYVNGLNWCFETPPCVLQVITSDSLRARLDVVLWDQNNEWVLGDLYLACNFPFTTTGKMMTTLIFSHLIGK